MKLIDILKEAVPYWEFKSEADFLYGSTIGGRHPDINGLTVYINQRKNFPSSLGLSGMTCTMVKLSCINPRNHGYTDIMDSIIDLSSPDSIPRIQKYFNDIWKECQPRYAWAAPLGLTPQVKIAQGVK